MAEEKDKPRDTLLKSGWRTLWFEGQTFIGPVAAESHSRVTSPTREDLVVLCPRQAPAPLPVRRLRSGRTTRLWVVKDK